MSDLKCERIDGCYHIDGKQYPSVTTILGKMVNKDGLDGWKRRNLNWKEMRDAAALTGTLMHLRILQRYSDAQIELPGEMAILRWPDGLEEELDRRDAAWDELGLNITDATVERTVVIKEHGADSAGTLDMRATVEGFKSILDLKSSKKIYETHFLQLGAYALGSKAEGYDAERGYVVALRDGNFEVGELEKDELIECGTKYLDLARKYHERFMSK